MLTVACVQTQDYCGRGSEYVEKLFDGIRRHMPKDIKWKGVCLTDDPKTVPFGVYPIEVPQGLAGWFNKIALFKPGIFGRSTRILYLDLDTIICGDIGDIARYDGRFAMASDFLHPESLNSSLMAWEAGSLNHIWTRWDAAGRPSFDPGGDQNWIGSLEPDADRWQRMFPGQVVSFKADCWLRGRIPDGARIVGFHGRPRNHECRAPYIVELWRGGIATAA